jgi:hypothetical protein
MEDVLSSRGASGTRKAPKVSGSKSKGPYTSVRKSSRKITKPRLSIERSSYTKKAPPKALKKKMESAKEQRLKKEEEKRKSRRKQRQESHRMYDLHKCETRRLHQLTDFATGIFGKDNIEKLKLAKPKIKSSSLIRSIWERTDAPTQCNNIIGPYKAGETECWICGLLIDPKLDGMKPECEHILPIIYAIILLGLYHSKLSIPKLDDRTYNKFILEYAWACKRCNRIKNDICGISQKDEGQRFEMNDKVINTLLSDIYLCDDYEEIKDSVYSRDIRNKLRVQYPTLYDFQRDRIPIITQKYEDIINFLNVNTKGSGRLMMLAGTALVQDSRVVNPDYHEILPVFKLSGKSLPQLSKEIDRAEIHKSYAEYSNDKESLSKSMLSAIAEENETEK